MSFPESCEELWARLADRQRRYDANMLCCNCASCPSMNLSHKPRGGFMAPKIHEAPTSDAAMHFGLCERRGYNVTADTCCGDFKAKAAVDAAT